MNDNHVIRRLRWGASTPPTIEEHDGPRQRLPADFTGRWVSAVPAGPRDPGLRAAVVEVRRRQGAGDPRALRHVGHPLLPGPQRADRPLRGPRPRPHARQAPAPPALGAPARPFGPAPRHRGLTTARAGQAMTPARP